MQRAADRQRTAGRPAFGPGRQLAWRRPGDQPRVPQGPGRQDGRRRADPAPDDLDRSRAEHRRGVPGAPRHPEPRPRHVRPRRRARARRGLCRYLRGAWLQPTPPRPAPADGGDRGRRSRLRLPRARRRDGAHPRRVRSAARPRHGPRRSGRLGRGALEESVASRRTQADRLDDPRHERSGPGGARPGPRCPGSRPRSRGLARGRRPDRDRQRARQPGDRLAR